MTLDEFNRLEQRDFENGAVLDEIAAVFKSRDSLQAIVDKLAKTADGVPILPRMCVFYCNEYGVHEVEFYSDPPDDIRPSNCYSTREAAENTDAPRPA